MSYGIDYPYTMRSPRALLMGDAYTAVANDDYTLFYNPAAMARHKADFSFYPLNGSISGTNVLSDLDRFKDFPDQPVDVADVLMDYPVHASAGVAPGIKFFNVGVSLIVNDAYDLALRNKVHPMMDLDIRSDRGVVLGVGIPLGSSRISKKNQSGSQTSIGIGAKYIERTGINDSLALAGPTVLDSLGEKEVGNLVKSLGQVKGRGWGFDAGVEHVTRSGPAQLVFGLSALDLTGTEFNVDKNVNNLQVSNIRDQMNFGMSGSLDWQLFNFLVSADVRGLNEQMDFGKRLRFGAQAGIPGIKLMAGINSGYYSYGATVDLIFLEVTGGFYDIEIGSKYKQTKSKRFVIYLSLFDFSFDA
jgi:hypothetical protein